MTPDFNPVMHDFPIVGVAASADRDDILRDLIAALPIDAGISFVIAASPDPSRHEDAVARYGALPVIAADQPVRIAPNQVYVAGQGGGLMVCEDGALHSANDPGDPVENLFRSFAKSRRSQAIALVLSGEGSCGVDGLRAVKSAGGIVLVQDPATAAQPEMPRSAIDGVASDAVLSPHLMADVLCGIAQRWKGRTATPVAGQMPSRVMQASGLLALVLDHTRTIRWVAPSVHRRLGLRDADIGQKLELVAQRPEMEKLFRDLPLDVGNDLPTTTEIEVSGNDGRIFLRNVQPIGSGDILVSFTEVTRTRRAEAERETLARDMRHRLKNSLSLAQALARMVDPRIQSVEAYRNVFLGRLQALAVAHDLLVGDGWQFADLGQLVARNAANTARDTTRLEIAGDRVLLSSHQAIGLSLVLHELASNAQNHGALSQPGGRVRCGWTLADDGNQVRLRWNERGGPSVQAPETDGTGLEAIRLISSYELDGEASLDFAPEGLNCTIEFPLSL